MDLKIKNIEEKITLIQNDMLNMSLEIYNQQKEILELKSNIKKLKFEIQNSQYNNVESLESSNETPPHY